MSVIIDLAEGRWVPDGLIRVGIRQLVRQRLREERAVPEAVQRERLEGLARSELALETDAANEQHYEVPSAFFRAVLGPRMKYSASIFPSPAAALAEAEEHTLELYRQRLGVAPGDRILDLGCGWGSFSLWLAEREPTARVVAVSNSRSQRAWIEARTRDLGLANLEVVTADVNGLHFPEHAFDKVISIEMFEHVRNYAVLLERISRWLAPGGALFAHVFCHREYLYPFETEGSGNWMGRHFFTGGQMPAVDTLKRFQDHLELEQTWLHDGTHYARTARAWLNNMDADADAVNAALRSAYRDQTALWQQRWRMFFMACEEMFAYDRGRQWNVAHYRFVNV